MVSSFLSLCFTQELLNDGFTLVYHVPPRPFEKNGEEEEADVQDQDWLGRSVTMTLQPGTCNADKVVPPQIVWKTMGGGMASSVETRSVPLLEIHSIASAPGDDSVETRDDEQGGGSQNNYNSADDELNCIFTLTANDGEVHVFESITAEESLRLVRGVKNLAARLSNQLISGHTNAVSDFYSNHGETDDIKLSIDDAMARLSHSFFD
jgi:hypothetical protein